MNLLDAMQITALNNVVLLPNGRAAICKMSRTCPDLEKNINQLYLIDLEGEKAPKALRNTGEVSLFIPLNKECPLVVVRNNDVCLYNPTTEHEEILVQIFCQAKVLLCF